jgi:acetolactate synthase-1/2/3 large subunit
MKATDLIANILKKNSLKCAFGLQGGAVVHIFDSLVKNKIKVIFTHHEESAALAATANAKLTNEIGCAVVTTGPGSTNAITGLLAAWQDSVPVIFISGQARSNHTSYGKKVRQVGTQEVNICDIIRPISKYSKFISKKEDILKEFNKAILIAKSGRPGPVWLDLALDIQWSEVKIKKNNIKKISIRKNPIKRTDIKKAIKLINKSEKPLFVLGYGLRSSNYNIKKLKNFFDKNQIPFVLTWNSMDLFPTSYSNNLGIIGMSGQRGANKAIFNSDLIICIGTHLSIPHTTTLYESYAHNAKKIIVNIDNDQLKNLNVNFDLKILGNLENFLDSIYYKIKIKKNNYLFNFKSLNWYEPKNNNYINSNTFIRKITKSTQENTCVIIDGGGTALYAGFQSGYVKNKMRYICSSAISSMGTGLAETIGSHESKLFKKFLCIIGDGSFLMNCQDLQTIFQEKINVIIILVNNNGYLAIRHTQKEFLNKRYIGTQAPKDISFPNFKDLAKAFKIKHIKINKISEMKNFIKKSSKIKGPLICEIITSDEQDSLFKQGYKKNINNTYTPVDLSEMYPFVEKPIANTNN